MLADRTATRPDVPETDSTFDADLLAPERVQASTMYRRVDAARFPNMDSALRMALNSGLEEKLDFEILRGTEGLLTGSKLANHNKSGETTTRSISLSSASEESMVDSQPSKAISRC